MDIVSSLEKNGEIDLDRMKKIRKGYLYPIPFRDANFKRWSAFRDRPIYNVSLSDVTLGGCKKVKKRHLFYVGKYFK